MRLRWSLFTKNMRPQAQLRLKLQQKVNKLEKRLGDLCGEGVHLKVNLERHPKKNWFTAAVTLNLPGQKIRAAKFSDDPLPAFDLAVRALLKELTSERLLQQAAEDAAKPVAARAEVPVVAAIASTALASECNSVLSTATN